MAIPSKHAFGKAASAHNDKRALHSSGEAIMK